MLMQYSNRKIPGMITTAMTSGWKTAGVGVEDRDVFEGG
jgi:hypothetical protein